MSEDGLDGTLPPPSMSICFLVVGTHGDINPFLGLADRLVALGHRVRVATHAQHRRLVLTRKHDFYPLGGDARKLSQWMVQTGGTVLGETKALRVIPEKTAMTKEIIKSTWPALTEPSPDDIDQRPFEADAVIANPPVFGHIHVAEALGIPLHIMFPQPWYYGTKEFPHPMIGLSYEGTSSENFHSYAGFEAVIWSTMSWFMNQWRRNTLDIPKIHFVLGTSTLIPDAKIPFSAMWSPAFVPKPKDWPEQCRVVGTFTDKKVVEKSKKYNVTPFQDLIAWLNEGDMGNPPIFVGFGSMVIKYPSKLAEMIMSAAEKADCRVIVQSSWSKLDVSKSERCHMVGPCPHDWLLPQTSAVVHHGGAGTTAAGLRWGLPTFICPFFGDQHMWGEMVRRAGVGPAPCPVGKLTDDLLAENFKTLLDPEIRAKAEELSDLMGMEDGIQGGLDHFLEGLPRDNMLCDVSLLLGEAKVAKYDVWGRHLYRAILTAESGIKVSVEVAAILKSWGYGPIKDSTSMSYFKQWLENLTTIFGLLFKRHATTSYFLGRVRNCSGGCMGGFFGCLRHLSLALIQVFFRPDQCARQYGLCGCLAGFIASPFYILVELFRAILVLFDRCMTGFCNGCLGKQKISTVDPHRETRVHETGNAIPTKVNEIFSHGIPTERKKAVYRAGATALIAKSMFQKSKPHYPEDHWHYKVVQASTLREHVSKFSYKLKLSEEEKAQLCNSLEERGNNEISFSMFLLLLRNSIETREDPRLIGTSMRSHLNPYNSEEGVEDWFADMFDETPALSEKVATKVTSVAAKVKEASQKQ